QIMGYVIYKKLREKYVLSRIVANPHFPDVETSIIKHIQSLIPPVEKLVDYQRSGIEMWVPQSSNIHQTLKQCDFEIKETDESRVKMIFNKLS
ncbi:MAG: hypothetical protein AB7O73_13730, partial [Bacteroidia bacterium]